MHQQSLAGQPRPPVRPRRAGGWWGDVTSLLVAAEDDNGRRLWCWCCWPTNEDFSGPACNNHIARKTTRVQARGDPKHATGGMLGDDDDCLSLRVRADSQPSLVDSRNSSSSRGSLAVYFVPQDGREPVQQMHSLNAPPLGRSVKGGATAVHSSRSFGPETVGSCCIGLLAGPMSCVYSLVPSYVLQS